MYFLSNVDTDMSCGSSGDGKGRRGQVPAEFSSRGRGSRGGDASRQVSLTLSHLLIRGFPAGCRVFLLLVTRRYSVVFVAPFIIRRLLLISACLLISVLGFLDHFPEAVAGLPSVRTPAPTAVLARPRAGRARARSRAPRSQERLTG